MSDFNFSFDPAVDAPESSNSSQKSSKFPFDINGVKVRLESYEFLQEEGQIKFVFVHDSGATINKWVNSPKSEAQANFLKKNLLILSNIVSTSNVKLFFVNSFKEYGDMLFSNISPDNELLIKVVYKDGVHKVDSSKIKEGLTDAEIKAKYSPYVFVSNDGVWFKKLTDTKTTFVFTEKEHTDYTVEIVSPDGSTAEISTTNIPPVEDSTSVAPKVLF